MLQVGGDINIVWRGVVGHIFRKLCKGDAVQLLTGSADIGEVNQRIVPANVVPPTETGVAGVGQVFLITFPGHSMKEQMSDNVVHVEAGGGVVVGGHVSAGHEPHQGGKRTVPVGIILHS